MKITQRHKNQQTFRGINLVQVPKNVFKQIPQLKTMQLVHTYFNTSVGAAKYKGSNIKYILNLFAQVLGLAPKNKFITIFEHPMHEGVLDKLKSMGNNYSLSWLRIRTGTDIKEPINPDLHSFFIYTKEHAKAIENIVNLKNLRKIGHEIAANEVPTNPNLTDFDIYAKIADVVSKKVDEITDGVPVKKFFAKNLYDLDEVLTKIEY